MRTQVQSLALLSGLRIWGCCELGCRSQAWLRSGIAVAVVQAGSCSFNSTPSLGTSICHRCGPKKMTKKKKKNLSLPLLTSVHALNHMNQHWWGNINKATKNIPLACPLVQNMIQRNLSALLPDIFFIGTLFY